MLCNFSLSYNPPILGGKTWEENGACGPPTFPLPFSFLSHFLLIQARENTPPHPIFLSHFLSSPIFPPSKHTLSLREFFSIRKQFYIRKHFHWTLVFVHIFLTDAQCYLYQQPALVTRHSEVSPLDVGYVHWHLVLLVSTASASLNTTGSKITSG